MSNFGVTNVLKYQNKYYVRFKKFTLQPVLKPGAVAGVGTSVCNACGALINSMYDHTECRKYMHNLAKANTVPQYSAEIVVNTTQQL